MNVADQFEEIAVDIDQKCFITSLEQMAHALFTAAYKTGISEAQVLHDAGKGDVADLNGKMDMIGHETEGMYTVPISLNAFLK